MHRQPSALKHILFLLCLNGKEICCFSLPPSRRGAEYRSIPMLLGSQGSAFNHLILIRQLLVFCNLLLHQIYLTLTESGLPFACLWCFSVCPLTHHQGFRKGKISRVWQYSCLERIGFDAIGNIRIGSQGWRQFSCVTSWAHPTSAQSAAARDTHRVLLEGCCSSFFTHMLFLASWGYGVFSRCLDMSPGACPLGKQRKQLYPPNHLETVCPAHHSPTQCY